MQTFGKTAAPTTTQHFTPLDQLILSRAEKKFGKLTAAEALSRAIHIEGIKKASGPFDVEVIRFANEQQQLEQYALLLEKASVVGMAQA